MNPNTTIRPWILACGKQYGIRQAHEYEWDDAESRQHEMYFTYEMKFSDQNQSGHMDMSTSSAYTVTRKAVQKWYTTVEVDLYNSEDGMFELASLVVAVKLPSIKAIFNDQCTLIESKGVENLSKRYAGETSFHQQLVVVFEEEVEFVLAEPNGEVEQVNLSIETGDPTYEITDSGITVT